MLTWSTLDSQSCVVYEAQGHTFLSLPIMGPKLVELPIWHPIPLSNALEFGQSTCFYDHSEIG